MKIPAYALNVKTDIIARAVKRHSAKCMYAQTVRLQIPGASTVSVTMEMVRFTLGDTRYAYPLPAKNAALLLLFDDGGEVVEHPLRLQDGFARKVRRYAAPRKKGKHGTHPDYEKTKAKRDATRCIQRMHGLREIRVAAPELLPPTKG